jgi:pimeloyl-ACP methyl ester carboxylesterase
MSAIAERSGGSVAIGSVLLCAMLCGCASAVSRSDALAERAGFTRQVVQGDGFEHVTYQRVLPDARQSGSRLLIFIEGDGQPWSDAGRVVADDPTSRDGVALQLALNSSSDSVLYLGRPCYLGQAQAQGCSGDWWTFHRYAPQVVQSLVAAANAFITQQGFHAVTLIGHSGGGTLAMLMAPQVQRLDEVVTIAGNLDVAAWSAHHHYLPLIGSLDPALQPPLRADIREVHLVGGADRNVPPALLADYRATHPSAQVWTWPDFDHHCCWQAAWPTVLPKLLEGRAGL